jgi:hypothetical protein
VLGETNPEDADVLSAEIAVAGDPVVETAVVEDADGLVALAKDVARLDCELVEVLFAGTVLARNELEATGEVPFTLPENENVLFVEDGRAAKKVLVVVAADSAVLLGDPTVALAALTGPIDEVAFCEVPLAAIEALYTVA